MPARIRYKHPIMGFRNPTRFFLLPLIVLIMLCTSGIENPAPPPPLIQLPTTSTGSKFDALHYIENLNERHVVEHGNVTDSDSVLGRIAAIVPLHTVVGLRALSSSRNVYFDVGSNRYSSSVGSWFYGEDLVTTQNLEWIRAAPRLPFPTEWEVHAFEANPQHFDTYDGPLQKHAGKLFLHKAAAWLHDGTIEFCKADYSGSIAGKDLEVGCGEQNVARLPSLDFATFIRETVRKEDFVVVKMDIEGGEHILVPHMLETGTFDFVDELFIECHYEGRGAGKRLTPGRFRRDCMKLIKDIRSHGVYAHEWF